MSTRSSKFILHAAADFGFPNIVPYLAPNSSTSNGVIFSVARSPVLDRIFFALRGILIPSYAVSLNRQLNWFKTHLRSVCASTADCRNRLANSLILLGDIEANDVGYALTQGKSINEVRTNYVPRIIQTQIDVVRELTGMGARRIIVPGSSPIGCFPYILTQFPSNDPNAYDQFGCLKSVNDLITFKNNILQQALARPNRNNTLKACCGIGGRYNYNSNTFCGSPGVPVCPDPNNYIFWDGLHLTQEAQLRIEKNLIQPALAMFNCTT
ncbi:GDSL esterase/lipase [Striga hermonthica]|uniref:GDSL esterase/lipase n=1 Tax=Striga hermonthica TaxID=68872 RepID=A0A9N7MWB5_STRHE|nr:GDSL esterase/lipase [Striga hermonthica]